MTAPPDRVQRMHRQVQSMVPKIHVFFSHFSELRYGGVELARALFEPFARYMRKFPFEGPQAMAQLADEPEYTDPSQLHGLLGTPYQLQASVGIRTILASGRLGHFLGTDIDRRFKYLTPSDRLNIEDSHACESLLRRSSDIICLHSWDPLLRTPDFERWLRSQIPETVARLRGIIDLFERLNVGGVLTLGAFRWNATHTIHLAKAFGLPSVIAQPLSLIGTTEAAYPLKYLPVVAFKWAVWGDEFKEWFQDYGVPPERLATVGNRRFDQQAGYQAAPRKVLFQLLGIPFSAKLITLAMQQLPLNKREDLVRTAARAVQPLKDVHLGIKLHGNKTALFHCTTAGCKALSVSISSNMVR